MMRGLAIAAALATSAACSDGAAGPDGGGGDDSAVDGAGVGPDGDPGACQRWVTIAGVQIMQYEASRPDATDSSQGVDDAFACAAPGVIPWTNITRPLAEAACVAGGARLCTEAEWETACALSPPPGPPQPPTYPVAGPATATDYVVIEAEHAQAITANTAGGTLRAWTPVTTYPGYGGPSGLSSLPDTGANINLGNAPTESPRLDFQIAFQQAADHYVWVRTLNDGSDNQTYVGVNATTPGTAQLTVAGITGVWSWSAAGPFAIPATGPRFVSVYMKEDGTPVDAVAVSRNNTVDPFVTNPGLVWAYDTNPTMAQPATCNADPYDTTPGGVDDDAIIPTGSVLTSCFANGAGADDAFDLSGNVKEWTAPRSAGVSALRGGASNNEVNGTSCRDDFTLASDAFFFPNTGFRCCR